MNGLWSLVLEFNGRRSGAAIVIKDGRILGGDSGMIYVGEIATGENDSFSGKITATQFLDHKDGFFPGAKEFEVAISGKHKEDKLVGLAAVSLAPGHQIALTGSRKVEA